jgi:hypothetical protein
MNKLGRIPKGKSAAFARGGRTPMLGKGDRTKSANPASPQRPGRTGRAGRPHSSRRNMKRLKIRTVRPPHLAGLQRPRRTGQASSRAGGAGARSAADAAADDSSVYRAPTGGFQDQPRIERLGKLWPSTAQPSRKAPAKK